jgi:hypothetical protein
MKWTGDNYSDLRQWGAPVCYVQTPQPVFDEFDSPWKNELHLWVEANKRQLPLKLGEWIAKDELGFYPIQHEMILKNYEETDHE